MKRLIYIVFIILTAVIASLVIFQKRSEVVYVAQINGVKIPYGEYMIYLREQQLNFEAIGGEDIWETELNGQPAFWAAKQNALDSLVYTKTMAGEAEKNRLILKNSKSYKTEAEEYYETLSAGERAVISLENCFSAMRDKQMTMAYRDWILEELTVDSEDFEIYYDEYVINNLEDIYLAEAKYVWLEYSEENSALALEIYQKALDGEEFERLISEYSQSRILSATYLSLIKISDNAKTAVLKLSPGETAPPVSNENGIFVVQLTNKIPLVDIDLLREGLYSQFAEASQTQYINNKYSALIRSVKVEKISDIWDEIEML